MASNAFKITAYDDAFNRRLTGGDTFLGGSSGSNSRFVENGGASGFEWNTEGGYLNAGAGLQAHGNFGATETIDPTDGNVHTGTLNADCTVTIAATAGTAGELLLYVTQDGTGGRDITWAGSVVENGTPDTTAGVTNRAVLSTVDAGTTWIVDWVGGTATALTVQDEGTPLATAADTLNFVGSGVVASGTGTTKTITVSGAPSGAAGGDLSGTYPNPSVVDDSHSHTTATAPGGGAPPPILLESGSSVPFTFDEILQASDGSDFLWASA